MTTVSKDGPFYTQPMLSDLYYHRDLLDFSAAGTLQSRHIPAVSIDILTRRPFIAQRNNNIRISAFNSRLGSCRGGSSSHRSCKFDGVTTGQGSFPRWRRPKQGGPVRRGVRQESIRGTVGWGGGMVGAGWHSHDIDGT